MIDGESGGDGSVDPTSGEKVKDQDVERLSSRTALLLVFDNCL